MDGMSGSLRARCRLALVTAVLTLSMGPAPTEIVVAYFDLPGWSRLGVLRLEVPPLQEGIVDDLIDGNPDSTVLIAGNPVTVALEFQSTQVVSNVVLEPGFPEGCDVTLTVVGGDGRRYAAGETATSGDQPASFQLPDVEANRLELRVDRDGGAGSVRIRGLRIQGVMSIDRISLDNVPATLPEGGSFPIVVTGHDSLGGRPELTSLAQLQVNPARALSVDGNRVVTRASGPIMITPRLEELVGDRRPVLVQPLQPAPPAPRVHAGHRQVQLELEGQPPFEILRRQPGDKGALSIGRADGQRFIDDSVEPGSAHQYSVRRIDAFGNALTPAGAETRARVLSRPAEGQVAAGRLPLLVVLYVDSFDGGQVEVAAIEESLEAARRFIFAHSQGRLFLDTTTIHRTGPTPATIGPSMALIERDLRRQGIADDAYGAVFVVADDLDGNWGNFQLLGLTAGAFGRSAGVPTPEGALGPDPAAAWSFVHEFQHLLEQRMAASVGVLDLPTGHFAQDHQAGLLGGAGLALDVGEGWDGQAALLEFTSFWDETTTPFRRPYERLDSDGDGLADADPALPWDELRAGSDPKLADTDGDGLDDLAELGAGLYAGSDPKNPDTDGDGLMDGVDPWPLSDFRGTIQRGPELALLASGPDRDAPQLHLSAAWDTDHLVFEVSTAEACDLFLDLDGSGSLGRWRSDVNTGSAELPTSDVWAGPSRIAVRPHHEPIGVFVGDRPLAEAIVETIQEDGLVTVRIRLPKEMGPGAPDVQVPGDAPLVSGLRLEPGQVLGVALTVRPSGPDDASPLEAFPEDGSWVSLFETHRLYDAVLIEPEPSDSPAVPTTAPPAEASGDLPGPPASESDEADQPR